MAPASAVYVIVGFFGLAGFVAGFVVCAALFLGLTYLGNDF